MGPGFGEEGDKEEGRDAGTWWEEGILREKNAPEREKEEGHQGRLSTWLPANSGIVTSSQRCRLSGTHTGQQRHSLLLSRDCAMRALFLSQDATMALPPTLFSTLSFCYPFVATNWQRHSLRYAASSREHCVHNLLSESVRKDRRKVTHRIRLL